MKWFFIGLLVLALMFALMYASQLGVFHRNKAVSTEVVNQEYIPDEEEVVPPPPPFAVLEPGSQIEIYEAFRYPKDTTSISMSGRNLTGSLKAEIRQMTELRSLDISNNAFTGLPAEIGQLSKLEVLNLSNNDFTGLPHELGNLQNLKTLDLRGNNISETDLEIILEALPEETEVLLDEAEVTESEEGSGSDNE